MKIILDLDGVLADFERAACIIHGRPTYAVTTWAFYREWGLTTEEFWAPIKAHPDFYSDVDPTPWFHELLMLVRQYTDDIVIATDNPLHPGLAASKAAWISKYLGLRQPVVMGSYDHSRPEHNWKALLSQPDRLLIDDCDSNIVAWRNHGGSAITFPQAWNSQHGQASWRLHYINQSLRLFFQLGGAA